MLDLSRLNERQKQAVLHGSGPLLILAGAGSGKTSTMTYRIAHLIAERHQPASSILGLSFTRKAAEELKERVVKLVTKVSGPRGAHGLTLGTFHGLCVRILRNHAQALGYQKDFTILDSNDQTDVVRGILKNLKLDDRKFDPDVIRFEIGQAKNRFLVGEQAEAYFLGDTSGTSGPPKMTADYATVTASTYARYQEQLRALNAMDFDDLIFNAVRVLEENADIRAGYSEKFRHILVDEYQDTNPAQFKLLNLLTERRQNLCVVGDDDQSIYGWRGADSTHILEFTRQFPAAKVVTLDQNYRSTSSILDAANQVIAQNRHRHPKKLWSDRGQGEPLLQIVVEEDRAEAEAVAEEILKRARTNVEGVSQQTRPWKDFAVLYRSNPQSRLFEEALRMRNIPYKIVGSFSFLDRKEVKDVLSYWRLIINPKDDASFRRVVNWPARGVGKTSLEALNTHAVQAGCSMMESIFPASQTLQPKAVSGLQGFHALIASLRQDLESTPLENPALANWALRSLQKVGVKEALFEDDSEDPAQAQKKWENAEELANALGQIKLDELLAESEDKTSVAVLREYLARLTLEALDAEEDEKEDKAEREKRKDQVTLLTLHGAKGLEFPVVFLVGMEEGLLPHRRTIEEARSFDEERRLCYVGITRAKDQLILTRTKNRIRYGKSVPRLPSRFLQEIPASLIVTQDESLKPEFTSKEAEEKHEEKVLDFLAGIRAQLTKK